MKANEAPEKIYFSSNENGTHYYTEGIPFERDYVEYTRTDAFIEKAAKWIELSLKYYSEGGKLISTDKMIEDFREYMKGE